MKLISLTKGYSTKVDDEDFVYLSQWKWQYHPKGYAYRRQHIKLEKYKYSGRFILMHRVLCPGGITTDHRNGDGLDNQKSNLRVATRSENQSNRGVQSNSTSGYKGVSFEKSIGRWRAYCNFQGKRYNLKTYLTAEEAARAYNRKALELHGEFALLNKLPT